MVKIIRCSLPKRPTLKRKRKNSFKYDEDHIVKALWKMQHEKCCYCENKIPLEGHFKNVEHFIPKAKIKALTNDWDNLLLACSQCNGKKSDKFPLELFKTKESTQCKVIYLQDINDFKKGSSLLINPVKEDPTKHLDFICDRSKLEFGVIIAKNKSQKGLYSIKTIGLSDPYFSKKHRHYIGNLIARHSMLIDACDNNEDESIDTQINYFNQIMKSNYQLAGLARSFVQHCKIDINYAQKGIKIPND